MIDRRLLVAICAALVALASGVLALALDAPVLGLVAGTGAVVAAAAAAVLTARLRGAVSTGVPASPTPRAHQAPAVDEVIETDIALNLTDAEHPTHPSVAPYVEPLPEPPVVDREPNEVEKLASEATDPVSGLLGAPYFYAALDRGVASARRQLQPLSLVLIELDNAEDADDATVDASMEVLGQILRRTLRECDTACRIGRTTAAVLLEDTPETGAVWAAERVRGGLLARPDGEHLTVSAGVASYPSHSLDATDLLQRAERALASARRQGRDRVEIALAD